MVDFVCILVWGIWKICYPPGTSGSNGQGGANDGIRGIFNKGHKFFDCFRKVLFNGSLVVPDAALEVFNIDGFNEVHCSSAHVGKVMQVLSWVESQEWGVLVSLAFTNLLEELREEKHLLDKTNKFFFNKRGHGKLGKEGLEFLVPKCSNVLDCFKVMVTKKLNGSVGDSNGGIKVVFHELNDFFWGMFVKAFFGFIHCFGQLFSKMGNLWGACLDAARAVGVGLEGHV